MYYLLYVCEGGGWLHRLRLHHDVGGDDDVGGGDGLAPGQRRDEVRERRELGLSHTPPTSNLQTHMGK